MSSTKHDEVTLYKRADGKWEWHRLNAYNGNVVATSGGQGYENYNDAYDQAYHQYGDSVVYGRADADPL